MLCYLKCCKWAGRYDDGTSLVLLTSISCQHYVPTAPVAFSRIQQRMHQDREEERRNSRGIYYCDMLQIIRGLQHVMFNCIKLEQSSFPFLLPALGDHKLWKFPKNSYFHSPHGRGDESNEARKTG